MATYVSKTWVDTIVDYPTRYILHHTDTTTEQITMENDFGQVQTSGDVFDAATFNNFELRVSDGFASCDVARSGTTDPSGSLGKDGDTYYKTETVNNITSVIGMFIKINGEWLEIQTGGAQLPQAEGGGF